MQNIVSRVGGKVGGKVGVDRKAQSGHQSHPGAELQTKEFSDRTADTELCQNLSMGSVAGCIV